jgi:hypothetical protein
MVTEGSIQEINGCKTTKDSERYNDSKRELLPTKKKAKKVAMKGLVSVQTLFIAIFVVYFQIVPWNRRSIRAIDTTKVDDRSKVRYND